MSTSPVQRTNKAIRDAGGMVGVVERFNPHVGTHGIRQDLFGFLDLVEVRGSRIIGVQCCAGSGYAAHNTKILTSPEAARWIRAAGIELWAWRKVKVKRGGKLMTWKARVRRYCPKDFDATIGGNG